MSVPNQYFGSASHMNAVLKQDLARVRAARPELFRARNVTQTKIDGEGKVTAVDVADVRATSLTPAHRHRLAWERR